MNVQVQPTQTFAITLEAQQWNNVLACLQDAPYKVSAPLIQAIGQQLQEKAEQLEGVQPNGSGGMMATQPN